MSRYVELIEKVARLICESVGPEGSSNVQSPMGDWPAWQDWTPQARAAIAAVAEWLDDALKDDDGRIYVPQFLRTQLEQPK